MRMRFTAATLAVALCAAAAHAEDTTYGAEIAQRQSEIGAIDRRLTEIGHEITRNEGAMRDLVAVSLAIDRIAAEASGREMHFSDSDKAEDPLWIAESMMYAPEPVESYAEGKAVEGAAVPPISIAGGQYTIRDGKDLLTTYEFLKKHMPANIEATKRLRQEQERLQKDRERLGTALAALQEGRMHAQASQAILGKWRLVTNGNGSVVEVSQNPDTRDYVAVLTVDELEYFTSGATLFVVQPMPERPGVFQGKEYGYDGGGLPKISPLVVSIQGDSMSYRTSGEALSWQRFVPYEERRAPLAPEPEEEDPEGFDYFDDDF